MHRRINRRESIGEIAGEKNAINHVCDSSEDNLFLRATTNKNRFPVIFDISPVNGNKFAFYLCNHPDQKKCYYALTGFL